MSSVTFYEDNFPPTITFMLFQDMLEKTAEKARIIILCAPNHVVRYIKRMYAKFSLQSDRLVILTNYKYLVGTV
jgi:hypothetical protein